MILEAFLTTLCGCQRKFTTTFPPPREIYIPLNKREAERGFLDIAPEDADDVFKTRIFELSEPVPYRPNQTAYYIERNALLTTCGGGC